MAKQDDTPSMAVFCDFENVALGVRDAKYEKFDIRKVLERLLLKGSIVVKKAYCDWARYREFKAEMHEASFELIEIPHVRQSGKNSADIRMVVDALDLCYTKSHVDTFVIISGDSDFSPLVSKLRENNKTVIGVGVKGSTSDLLTANCDEFIFYDDLVREQRRRGAQTAARRDANREPGRGDAARGDAARGDAGRGESGRGESGRGDSGRGDSGRGDSGRGDSGRGDSNRGGRGNGRGPDRDGQREPLRSVPAGPAALAASQGAQGAVRPPPHDESEDVPSVGGPWRRWGPEPRDATLQGADAASGDTLPGETGDGAAMADAQDADAVGAPDDAPAPAAPGRRPRRSRARGTATTAAIGGDTVTAADFFAEDVAEAAAAAAAAAQAPDTDAAATQLGADATAAAGAPAAEAAPVADGPKKRAPRRRKTAAPAPEAQEAEPVVEPRIEPRTEPAVEARADDVDDTPGDDGHRDDDRSDERATEPEPRRQRSEAERRQEAVELAVETVEALLAERGADDKIWGSMVKQTLKRRRPGFAESYYGFRSFNEVLEEARDRGLLALEHDEKSGGYVIQLL
ncbi:MAG: NYN domain-containing protein [Burkholderiales bacterium]|nr:NYN domain-containing protein [Burkholderiales bacterium]